MKRIFFLAVVIFIGGTQVQAQSNYGGTYNRYNTGYNTPLLGSNGFRSVEDENKRMDELLAERRRERMREEMTPEQQAAENEKQADLAADRKKAADARAKAEEERTKKKAVPAKKK